MKIENPFKEKSPTNEELVLGGKILEKGTITPSELKHLTDLKEVGVKREDLEQARKDQEKRDVEAVNKVLEKISGNTTPKETPNQERPRKNDVSDAYLEEARAILLKNPEYASILPEIGNITDSRLALVLAKINRGEEIVNLLGNHKEALNPIGYFFDKQNIQDYQEGDPDTKAQFAAFFKTLGKG